MAFVLQVKFSTSQYFSPYAFIPAPLPSLATANMFLGSLSPFLLCIFLFYFLVCTYKWYHKVFLFLFHISLSMIPFRSIHVVVRGHFLCGFVIYHVCVCVCVYENFLIHLSINGHFGGSMSWLLSAKCHEHKGVYIFLDPWFCFMRKILPSIIPASHGSCRVNFLRTCVLFSIAAVPMNFPNKMHEDSPHLHQYLIFVVFWMIASFSGVRW